MGNEGRFLGKRFDRGDGFLNDRNIGVLVEDDVVKLIGPARVNDGSTIQGIITATATFSMAATLGVVGSLNFSTSIDVPFTGAAVGDQIISSAIASVGFDLLMRGTCLTANYVRMDGAWTATTGAHGAFNLPIRITAFKW